jgi:hypothetical protein
LNPQHHHMPPFSDRLTPILYCYKNIISILATLPTTQPHLYFTSSLAKAPRHMSFTCRRCSLLSSSHIHHQHRHRPPSSDHLTPIIYWYKNVISTLATLSTTQPCLYFTSSLARAPPHKSFTCRRCSLSSSSHIHHPSAQQHPQ